MGKIPLAAALFGVLAVTAAPAMAAPAGIYMLIAGDWNTFVLEKAINADLADAGIKRLPAVAHDALIVSIPQGLEHSNDAHTYQFGVLFYWQGRKLAESEESCPDTDLKACGEQFVQDLGAALAAVP